MLILLHSVTDREEYEEHEKHLLPLWNAENSLVVLCGINKSW